MAAEYREAFGEHAYDEQGNYIGIDYTTFDPDNESQAAWADLAAEYSGGEGGAPEDAAGGEEAGVASESVASEPIPSDSVAADTEPEA